MTITLYEYTPTRSAKVRWLLKEMAIEFTSVNDRHLIGSDELKAINHTGKLPAIVVDGHAMFESSAICTYLADKYPEKGLIPKAGTWARAMHEQWVSFALTEVEAHLWSTARNTFIYPDALKVPEIIEQNNRELASSLPIIDGNLSHHSYMLGEDFSVTDIIVGFTTIWAHKQGLTQHLPKIEEYNLRLTERPHCPLKFD
ncbi:glutathione S-transferase family protein [Thalassotalea aquiviva]|uniref:glutathione S-transferase family protein n=1 Tax=Thalassotalea aquiviva TaxID=3242415 RepID=UPI003529FA9E